MSISRSDIFKKISVAITGIVLGSLNIDKFGNKISKDSYIFACISLFYILFIHSYVLLTYKYNKSEKHGYKKLNNKHHNNIKDLFYISTTILNISYCIITIDYYNNDKNVDKVFYNLSVSTIVISILDLIFVFLTMDRNYKIVPHISI